MSSTTVMTAEQLLDLLQERRHLRRLQLEREQLLDQRLQLGGVDRLAALEELGQLAEPPMTKDAVAGRIRRLLHMADKRAADLGIPDTESAVTAEMLEEA